MTGDHDAVDNAQALLVAVSSEHEELECLIERRHVLPRRLELREYQGVGFQRGGQRTQLVSA